MKDNIAFDCVEGKEREGLTVDMLDKYLSKQMMDVKLQARNPACFVCTMYIYI